MTVVPVRMRLSRAKGFRLQEASMAINGLPAVNCARPGKFGNPFTVRDAFEAGCVSSEIAAALVEAFRRWFEFDDPPFSRRRERLLAAMPAIRNHNLACWCPLPEPGQPDHCHAACLLEIANR